MENKNIYFGGKNPQGENPSIKLYPLKTRGYNGTLGDSAAEKCEPLSIFQEGISEAAASRTSA